MQRQICNCLCHTGAKVMHCVACCQHTYERLHTFQLTETELRTIVWLMMLGRNLDVTEDQTYADRVKKKSLLEKGALEDLTARMDDMLDSKE